MGVENTIGSSVTSFSTPSISSAPSFGGGVESFSFADTVPLSAPSEISLGGSYRPEFNFADLDNSFGINLTGRTSMPSVFETGLADINLDPDLPNYEIPQVFYDAFSDEDLLNPQQYFEQINIVDIPKPEPQNNIIEQINYSNKPEIDQIEAKIESVIPSEIEDRAWPAHHRCTQTLAGRESTQFVEDCHVASTLFEPERRPQSRRPRNDNYEISDLVLVEAAEELVSLSETPIKFVVDEAALTSRDEALRKAVEIAPVKIDIGDNVVDSNLVAALMPTEVQNPGVSSAILPKHFIEWLNRGDGSYRLAVSFIKSLGIMSKSEILQKGLGINRRLPPVTIAERGVEVGEEDIKRVKTFRSRPAV